MTLSKWRPPYGLQELSRLINPASVAVVGASPTAGSFGKRTLENIAIGYAGEVYAINPRHEQIGDVRCYTSIRHTPKVPDCVVLAVAREQVQSILEECADLGVGGAIIYASGYSELGTDEGVKTQQRFQDIGRASGMRICGPNCVGVINLASRIGLTFMPNFCASTIVPGSIGLVSQSGALGYVVLQAMERGIGFSHYLSPGNSCDVDVCDLINYLVEDESTRAIACTFEGVADGARLRAACRNALAAGKPVVVYKLGNNEISRRTAMSHTGTMVGATAAYRALFDETGVTLVDDFEQMLETVSFFAKTGAPTAHGIGVMASSGGAAVMGADKATECGLQLPEPSAQTAARMREVIPSYGSSANPSDITAESLRNMEMYGHCIEAFANDPGYGAVVVPMMSAQSPATVDRARYICERASRLSTPICIVWLNEWYQGPGSEVYDASPHLMQFRSMGRCMRVLRNWLDYHTQRQERLAGRRPPLNGSSSREAAARLLRGKGLGRTLTERMSKDILAAYGVRVARGEFVKSLAEAARAADTIGYPVALKAESPSIPHKTEAGVVRLSLKNESELRRAYRSIRQAVKRLPDPRVVDGMVVQEMVAPGLELMIGVQRDSQFGPMVACGLGGTLVEVLQDVAVALAPVDVSQAMRLIRSLRGYRLLEGYRGAAAVDADAFADMIVRVSELAADFVDDIAEIDVNPVIMHGTGGIAADALVVRTGPD